MAKADQKRQPEPHIRIGYEELGGESTTLGEVALNPETGEIEIVSGDREKLARLLASMFHARYKDEADLYRSLTARLNNGYMWAHEVDPKKD